MVAEFFTYSNIDYCSKAGRLLPIMEPISTCPNCDYYGAHLVRMVGPGKWQYACLECDYLWPI